MKAHQLGYRLPNFQNHVINLLRDMKLNAQVPIFVYVLAGVQLNFFFKFNKCEMIQLKCQQFSPRLRNAGCKKTTEISGKRNSRPTYD